jgi:hypothetical protein
MISVPPTQIKGSILRNPQLKRAIFKNVTFDNNRNLSLNRTDSLKNGPVVKMNVDCDFEIADYKFSDAVIEISGSDFIVKPKQAEINNEDNIANQANIKEDNSDISSIYSSSRSSLPIKALDRDFLSLSNSNSLKLKPNIYKVQPIVPMATPPH